ncbi:MAG: hypothetical protein GYB65_01785 [Chloroflexi bacterium]|nr:hypothetical protein [Chloroflexota bacterium]
MKRLVVVILCVCLIAAPVLTVAAQDSAAPRYAVAFRGDETVYVATLYTDNTWDVQPVSLYMLFGQYDLWLVTPRWTADGQLIGSGFAPDYSGPVDGYADALYLYAYDRTSGQSTQITPGPVLDMGSEWYYYEFLAVQALSPDGRFVLATAIIGFSSHLVDVQDGRVVAAFDCEMEPIAWRAGEVLLQPTFNGPFADECNPQKVFVDLATGQTRAAATPANQYDLWLVPLEGSPPVQLEEYATDLVYSPDGTLAAYRGDYGVFMYYDLLTNTPHTVLTTSRALEHVRFAGSTLHFWEVQTEESGLTLTRATYSPADGLRETVMYAGPAGSYLPAPNNEAVAVELDSAVQVYDASGLRWDSQTVFPDTSVLLDDYDPGAWSADGQWLHVEVRGEEYRSVAVNWATGQQIVMGPDLVRVGESPDGSWWLYVVLNDLPGRQSTRLVAFRPDTRQTATLSDGPNLYLNLSFMPSGYFVWSGLLSSSE